MFHETVVVDRRHLTALLDTLARTAPTPPLLPAALQELANALHGQDPDADTYTHLALRAEDHVQRQLLAQAPRTDAAMEALAEAELVLLQAERELHASYLYGNAHITERRCLTCEVTYPCPPARALGLGEGS